MRNDVHDCALDDDLVDCSSRLPVDHSFAFVRARKRDRLLSYATTHSHRPETAQGRPGPGRARLGGRPADRYGLSMFGDLKNPVKTTAEATPGLFRKAGDGPVRFRPMIALGSANPEPRRVVSRRSLEGPGRSEKIKLWSYVYKNTTEDLKRTRTCRPAGSRIVDRIRPGRRAVRPVGLERRPG